MNQNNNFYYQYPPAYTQPTPQQVAEYYKKQQDILQKKHKQKVQILITGFVLGGAILLNLMFQVFGISIINAIGLSDLYNESMLFQSGANIIIIDFFGLFLSFGLMALLLKKHFITPLIPHEKISAFKAFMWLSLGMGVCLCANYMTNGIIELFKHFGYELTKYDTLKPTHPLECVMLVISTAVAPAIFEEFAMRCASLGVLRKHGKGFAVIAVSIVFGLLHGNVIQFVFAFVIGLILAYITIVTDSIVPAMLIHGCNNGLSVLQDILQYATTKKISDNVITVIFIVWFVLAVIALIYLLITKSLFKKEPKEPVEYRVPLYQKLALLLPGLFIPFVILVYVTSKTIVPIS
ncbi:MAG: CPBP family intramembrane metalloprotease [Eubacterium sp.]|nr:CPBP family intramembrane metalloprotease [Eubacterium sp.]